MRFSASRSEFDLFLRQLAFAARRYPDVVESKWFVVMAESANERVDVRVLLDAARVVPVQCVDELTRVVLEAWVTDRLVEGLCEVVGVEQLYDDSLWADADGSTVELSHCRTTLESRIRQENTVSPQVNNGPLPPLNHCPTHAHEETHT